MKKVELVISHLDDMDPISTDDFERGKIRLRVQMTDKQIAYNRMVLIDQQVKDREIPKIRAVR